MNGTPRERFDAKWTPEPFSGCWLWMAGPKIGGYGMFDHVQAHRVAWMFYRGNIPPKTCVLHHCDTPSCVNPDHLFLGTGADNMRDKCLKGRWRGWQPVRFTAEQVKAIRLSTLGYRKLAKQLGCSQSTIKLIKRRMTWKHIP